MQPPPYHPPKKQKTTKTKRGRSSPVKIENLKKPPGKEK
jgi:hypothetical protein